MMTIETVEAEIAQKVYKLDYDVEDSGIQIRFLRGERDISLLHSLQTGSGVRVAYYPVVTGSSFPCGEEAEVIIDPLTSSTCRG